MAYGTVSNTVDHFTTLGIDQQLAGTYRAEILEKRARLAYCNIEDNATWDLITRVCKEPELQIRTAFCNILEMVSIVVRVGSLLLLITTQVWWAGIVILAISVPLFLISKKAGQKEYTAWKEAEKHRPPRRLSQKRHSIARGRGGAFPCLAIRKTLTGVGWNAMNRSRRIEQKTLKEQFIRMKASSIITALLSLSIIAILLFPTHAESSHPVCLFPSLRRLFRWCR